MGAGAVLIADARVLAIPIADCGEPLVDLRTCSDLAWDERKRDAEGSWLCVRAGVASRLRVAQRACPPGAALLVVEGYRPLWRQRAYFDEHAAALAARHPGWTARQVRTAASRHVAPPDIVPPHCTGAAVDVTLVDADGHEQDLGCPLNATPEDSDGRCFTDARDLAPEAARARAALCHAMAAGGFVNYPPEWWHWSYGDRYWAFALGADAALYGPTDRP